MSRVSLTRYLQHLKHILLIGSPNKVVYLDLTTYSNMYLHDMNLSEYLIWEETHNTCPKYLSDMTFLIGSLSALCLFTDHEVSLGN
jgi:hypothetical protein